MQQDIRLSAASQADYPVLIDVVHKAFEPDKRRFGQGPDFYEDPAALLPLLRAEDGCVRKLCLGEKTVGLIVTFAKTPTARWLGCICLLPEWQGWGYGTRALELLEEAYPNVTQWGLDTPAVNTLNLRFYQKAGYRIVGENENPGGPKLAVLEKRL